MSDMAHGNTATDRRIVRPLCPVALRVRLTGTVIDTLTTPSVDAEVHAGSPCW